MSLYSARPSANADGAGLTPVSHRIARDASGSNSGGTDSLRCLHTRGLHAGVRRWSCLVLVAGTMHHDCATATRRNMRRHRSGILAGLLLCAGGSSACFAQTTSPALTVSNADNAWMLVSSALVLMMTGPGLALFYGGLVRTKERALGDDAEFFCHDGASSRCFGAILEL